MTPLSAERSYPRLQDPNLGHTKIIDTIVDKEQNAPKTFKTHFCETHVKSTI